MGLNPPRGGWSRFWTLFHVDSRGRATSWAATIPGTLWTAHISVLGLLVMPLVLLTTLLLLRRRRLGYLAIAYGISPLAVFTAASAYSYTTGTAYTTGVGLPGPSTYNIDPETRVRGSSRGCIAYGNEWLVDLPNNATISLLSAVFGPMPGTYDGPYPTLVDAELTARGGVALSWDELKSDRIPVRGRHVKLAPGFGNRFELILRDRFWERALSEVDDPGPPLPRAGVFHGRVLVLQFHEFYALVDAESGLVFAYWGFLGREWRDLPPVWSPFLHEVYDPKRYLWDGS